jgi:hypothetical protein
MRRCHLFALCLFAGCSPVAADPPKATPVTFYDANPDHLWNRLHAALLTRPDHDGNTIGRDSLDPLLWPTTKRLIEGPSHAEAVKLLDEFLTRDGDKLVRDPVKRAVFQRDLWGVFDWATHPFGNHYVRGEPIQVREGPLQVRLASAIRKLAPSKAETEALPGTYAVAVKSKAFPTAFDPAKPDSPFLPPDLFDETGPWVCVTNPRGSSDLVARTHARVFSGRSVFLVFIKLPAGRDATLAYLDKLNTFPKPWIVPPQGERDDTGRRITPVRNPDVPQFPAGTQVALVRQLVVVTNDGKLIATPLTESVQFRTYREILPREKEHGAWARQSQGFVEFELRRTELFAGTNGGLRPIKGDELVSPALSFFQGWSDPFETKSEDTHHRPVPAFGLCVGCHRDGGIRGVNSYTQSDNSRPPLALGLVPSNVAAERKKATEWKTGLKDWAALKKAAEW